MQGCQAANARRSQVWAEALDAWLRQLAREIVQEHTSQALTPANVQASLQLLLAKVVRSHSEDDHGPQGAVTFKHHLQPLLSSPGSNTYMPQPCSQYQSVIHNLFRGNGGRMENL
ncbi:TPA: hypothetical protein ACH3X2_003800 [Trebouxia sp. C0005]